MCLSGHSMPSMQKVLASRAVFLMMQHLEILIIAINLTEVKSNEQ